MEIQKCVIDVVGLGPRLYAAFSKDYVYDIVVEEAKYKILFYWGQPENFLGICIRKLIIGEIL